MSMVFKYKYAVYITLFISMFSGVLTSVFGVPGIIVYVCDLMNCLYFTYRHIAIKKTRYTTVIGIAILVIFIGIALNMQSPLLILWGARNNFRFLIFSVMVLTFMSPDDIRWIERKFNFLILINFALILYEYLFLGSVGDYLGGVFGVSQGCNGGLNIFLVIMSAYYIINFIETDGVSTFWLIVFFITSIIIGGLSELKFLFIELILVVLICGVFSRWSLKKIIMIVLGILVVQLGFSIYAISNPNYADNASISALWNSITSSTSYGTENDIGRSNQIEYVMDHFLHTPMERLFGIGFGNGEYSSTFDFFTSETYRQYSSTHYFWFSAAWMLLETGLIGLIVYLSIFILYALDMLKRYRCNDDSYYLFGFILAIMTVINVFYNVAMRTDYGYLMYFAMMIPYIMEKEKRTNLNDE